MKAARPLVMVIAALLAAGAGTSEFLARRDATTSVEAATPVAVASIKTRDASGAVWFCPMVASTDDNTAAALRISRPPAGASGSQAPAGTGTDTGDGASLLVTLYGPAGEISATPVELTNGAVEVAISSLLRSAEAATLPSISATVESNDPLVIVEANLGTRSAGFVPCSTTVSPSWYIPVGSTSLQHTTELALFNPFPGTALVDLQFWSERGADRPTALQGVAVPGGSLRVIELGDFVRRRERLATEVAVRSGRVIAATNHRFGGRAELSVGVPALSTQLFVPAAMWTEKRPEQFTFLNPGDSDSTIELTVTLAPDDVEPFELIVPAGSSATFNPSTDGRVPAAAPYAVVAQVSAGPDVAMSRTVLPSSGSQPHFSQPAAGGASMEWVAPGADAQSLTVFNPYDVATEVTVSSLGQADKLLKLASGDFANLTLTDGQRAGGSLSVSSNAAPVVVSVRTTNNTDVVAIPLLDR